MQRWIMQGGNGPRNADGVSTQPAWQGMGLRGHGLPFVMKNPSSVYLWEEPSDAIWVYLSIGLPTPNVSRATFY